MELHTEVLGDTPLAQSKDSITLLASTGVFVATIIGETIQISVPAKTCNDWKRESQFLDLPLMDDVTFKVFVETISRIYSATVAELTEFSHL